MATEGERLATVEAVLLEIRADVHDLRSEMIRSLERLHEVESVTSMYLKTQQVNRENEEEQYRRLGLKVQWAGVAIAVAAVAVTLISVLLTGR